MKKVSSQSEDLQLVKEIKKGSEKAFSILYKKYSGKINFHFLKKTKNDVELSQDLTLEVFGKIFEKINKYNTKYALSTWIFTIANNQFKDHIRKQRVEILSIETLNSTDEEGEEMGFQLESDFISPEQELIKAERILAVQNFIDNIKNDDMKQFAIMRYIDELSYKEIEELTGKPIGTVKAVLNRARKDIANQIKQTKFDRYLELI
jgi:RNA polymerase sigma-70 factor (ECF subfamily)